MSYLTPYWRWAEEGAFYGMPVVNLLGWGTTALLLMAALEWLAEREKLGTLPLDWVAAYYATVLLLPLGMIAAAGLWPAVLATLAGVAALTVLSLREPRSTTAVKDVRSEPAWTS
jgi:putative membrane protein